MNSVRNFLIGALSCLPLGAQEPTFCDSRLEQLDKILGSGYQQYSLSNQAQTHRDAHTRFVGWDVSYMLEGSMADAKSLKSIVIADGSKNNLDQFTLSVSDTLVLKYSQTRGLQVEKKTENGTYILRDCAGNGYDLEDSVGFRREGSLFSQRYGLHDGFTIANRFLRVARVEAQLARFSNNYPYVEKSE